MPRNASSARRRARSQSSFGLAVDLPRGLTLVLVTLCTLAAAGLGAQVRLSSRLPVPVEGQIRRQVAETLKQDLAASGSVGSARDLDAEAQRILDRGSYTVQSGPMTGQTLNLREQMAQMTPQIESLYTYASGGRRYSYLSDLDTYHWMAAAERIQKAGHPWAKGPDGKDRDPWSLAPRGFAADGSWHPRVLALWHAMASPFLHGAPLQETTGWWPVVFGLLAVMPVALLAGFCGGAWAAPVAALLLAYALPVVGRTFWGHADTDLYNVFFPALAAAFLAGALHDMAQDKRGSGAMWTVCAGMVTGLHAHFWVAWWAPWILLAASATLAAFALAIFETLQGVRRSAPDLIQATVLVPLAFLATGVLAVLFLAGPAMLAEVWRGPARFAAAARGGAGFSGLWPNVFGSVGELARPGLAQLLADLGGVPMLALAGVGIVLGLVNAERPGRRAIVVLVAAFAAATMLLATRGLRFELLAAPALLVLAAAGASSAAWWIARALPPSPAARTVAIGVLALAVGAGVVWRPHGAASAVSEAARQDIPQVTSTWGHVLDAVRDSTDRLDIVTTWWDKGHPVKYLAQRGVTIDGQTFQEPEALWVSRALLASDEVYAASILQMLDGGGARVLDSLAVSLGGVPRADRVLRAALAAPDSASVRDSLRAGGVEAALIERAALMIRPIGPRVRGGALVVSDEMIPTAVAWGALGAWDFTRAMAMQLRGASDGATRLARGTGLDATAAAALIAEARAVPDSARAAWCGTGPSVMRGPEPAILDQSGGGLRSPSGAWIRPELASGGLAPADGGGTPAALVFPDRNGVTVIETGVHTSDLALVLLPGDFSGHHGLSLLTTNRSLATGLCVRLLYFGGAGLQHFTPLAAGEGIRGGAVRAFRVRWTEN